MDLWKVLCVVCAQLLSATGSLGQLDVCGRPPLNTKIVGGDDASAGAWPWQASIQARGRHFCGGSLISKNWVLSAAHCFQSITAGDITIFLGMESLEGTNPNMQKKTVLKIINHENYNSTTINNDIALVQLSSSVTFNNYVMPVCLAASNSLFPGGSNVWVTGWGRISSGESLPSPKTLQEVQVSVVSSTDCAKAYGSGSITDNMICAAERGKDSCQGDSGGPLVVKNNGTWVQAGIVSFGKGCAVPDFPGVYTRVSQYQDWINRQIGSNQLGFVTSTNPINSRVSPNHFLSRSLILSFSIIPFLLSLSIFQRTFLFAETNDIKRRKNTLNQRRHEIMDIYLQKVVCVVCALLLNATGSLSQLDVCGRPPLNPKIVGGDNAPAGAWPWQVSVQARGRHFCGGSLINKNWVLSAAHCFQSMTAPEVMIFLGMESLEGTNPNMQEKSVRNIINHQYYDPDALNNDIALIQLSSSVTFTSYVMPVCLAANNSSFPDGTKVWVTGWGYIDSDVNLPSPKTLQEVQVPIVSNSNCAKAYGPGYITDKMMCAGLAEGGKDSCQGDSGGPLVIESNGAWVQAGIVSFGKGCALPDFPGVYARVSQYQDWINSQIGSNQVGFVQVSNGNCISPNLFCLFLSLSIIPFLLSFCSL
ncbi:uncharacterized protein LOC132869062 [Neoarius graeffei]|uniref:uncharacterized protein LOC132869062 n=1 Tax=Neoarius graeffei TaxID=443677 RepID=UPI00298D1AAF|nr:uncharacterized protein LOC132869062 [Neoarius graeffei]